MMKFPNAAKGVKKIFTAEVLSLIGSLIAVVGTVSALIALLSGGFSLNDVKSGEVWGMLAGAALLMLLSWIVMGVFRLIAVIFRVIGISQAKKDEDSFTGALFFQVVSIVTTIMSIVFPLISVMASGFLDSVTKLLDVFVLILVISGVIKLSDKLNNGEIARKGVGILKLIIVVNILALVGSLATSFMGGAAASVTTAVISIVVAVLTVIQSFMYLSFLSQSKRMLQKAR